MILNRFSVPLRIRNDPTICKQLAVRNECDTNELDGRKSDKILQRVAEESKKTAINSELTVLDGQTLNMFDCLGCSDHDGSRKNNSQNR